MKIDAFEGPLDLLLHLIKELEIDIYDIPVAEITEQYIGYIKAMEQIELNVASEYLVMAATLISMKSEMLLPKKEQYDEDEYVEDSRDELMSRLIEYRKYKEAASSLQEKELEDNQIFTRPPAVFETLEEREPVVVGNVSLFRLVDALDHVMERREWTRPLDTTVNLLAITVEERMKEIMSEMTFVNGKVAFESLFAYPSKSHIVTTFLALLQLLKNKQVECEQVGNFESIYLYRVVT